MLRSQFARRQRMLGGLAGVLVLIFALAYHFFPVVLHVSPRMPVEPEQAAPAGVSSLMGFERRPGRRRSEVNAGPPIALAPHAVLERRARDRVLEALARASSSAVPKTPPGPEVIDLLQRADKAFQNGNLAGGQGSAADLYMRVLQMRPGSPRAANGLAKVHVNMVASIKEALSNGDLDVAAASLEQLKKLPGTGADVQQLQHELESSRAVRPLLAKAARLLQQGKILAPQGKGRNALDLYRQVLEVDPGNTVALQSIEHIQRQVLDKALGAVARNDSAAADAALAQAAEILPGSQALQNTRGRIEGIRRQHAANIMAQARTALDSGNVKLAEKLKNEALAISPDIQGIDQFDRQLSNARLYANYQPGQVFSDRFLDMAGNGPAMVVVPTGSFMMGSAEDAPGHQPDESPQHRVHVAKGFAIGRSDITVGQFRAFVRASGYVPDSVRLGGSSVYDGRTGVMRTDHNATWEDNFAGRPAKDTLPVVNVSWNDAHAYVQWLSQRTGKQYRLPSEAQFEYALRAGTNTLYWWGNGTPGRVVENLTGSGDQSRLGRRWTHAFKGYRDGYWGPAPIQSFAPNPFGLYDMGGNVSEWVRDCWHDNYTQAPDDGSAWINPGCTDRVLRGGSWGSAPDQVRSAWRRGAPAGVRSGRVGFRVVREL